MQQEFEYFAKNYHIEGDLEVIYEKNAKLAEENFETDVANIWRNTFFILEASRRFLKKF